MSVFKQSNFIQLRTEEEDTTSSNDQLFFTSSKKLTRWSIPCCVNLSLKRTGNIQLPNDSDNEEEYDESSFIPHNFNSESSHSLNLFSQQTLSHNPFARVSDREITEQNIVPDNLDNTTELVQNEVLTRGEELVDFSKKFISIPETEATWSEPYQDEPSEEEDGEEDDSAKIFNDYESSNSENGTDLYNTSNMSEETLSNNVQSIPSLIDQKETEDNSIKTEDPVPQLDENVLHMLPLPRLSREIPSELIHKKPSFENSMYNELPLLSSNVTIKNEPQLISPKEDTVSKSSSDSGNAITPYNLEAVNEYSNLNQETLESLPLSNTYTSKSPDQKLNEQNLISNEKKDTHKIETQSNPQKPTSSTNKDRSERQQQIKDQRRQSTLVTEAAQSMLGDKFDLTTKTLAYIKKSIIMGPDSDDDDDDDDFEDIKQKAKTSIKAQSSINNAKTPLAHKRSSSLMEAVPSIARLVSQIGGNNNNSEDNHQSHSNNEHSNHSFSPSSFFSAFAGPMPESLKSTEVKQNERNIIKNIREEDDEDDEEIFDINKVIDIGKNVKTLGETFVGNSFRIIGDMTHRLKTNIEHQKQKLEEEQRNNRLFFESEFRNEIDI